MNAARRPFGRFLEAGVLALLGAGVLLDAQGYPPALTEGAPGPAFFPRLVAALLLASALGLAIRSLRRETPDETPPPSAVPDAGESRAEPGRNLRVWAAAGAIAVFLFALPYLGTLAALPLLLFGLMHLAGERARVVLVAAPLAFAGFVVFLFEFVLGVPLP